MTTFAGNLLVAQPQLVDPNFFRTVILLLEHDEDGAIGVVLNRPTGEAVADHLPSWTGAAAEPSYVFFGGPVEPTGGIGLGRGVLGELTLLEGISMVDLEDPTDRGEVRVFAGYAGWGAGQLEAEIQEGAWLVVAAQPDDVLNPDPDRMWQQVLRRQGGEIALLSTFPDDLRAN